jgi:hypothetical protein
VGALVGGPDGGASDLIVGLLARHARPSGARGGVGG